MSTGTKIGSILGIVAGAALGLAFPPAGVTGFALAKAVFGTAMLGFTIGGGIGGYLDPLSADVSGIGSSQDLQDLDYPTSVEGTSIPDFVGTVKVTGNFLGYWNNHQEEVTDDEGSEVEGGKGGGSSSSSSSSSHYEYYLTWIMGLAMGPVDEIVSVYRDQDCVWSGSVKRTSGNPGSITIDDIGQIYIYWGTSDQPAPTAIAEYVDYNVPYRNQCYVLFNDCYIGDYNRVPTFYFVLRKLPECSTMGAEAYRVITTSDINPAHAIWYCLTSPFLCGMSESYMDVDSFAATAQTLSEEDFGIDLLFDEYTSAISYLEAVLAHIDGVLRYNNLGKFELMLIRGTMALADMPTIDMSDVQEAPAIKRRSWLDTMNELKVQYTLRDDCYTNPEDEEEEE